MKYKSIGIVGGGTAGYLAALVLNKSFPDKQITLIESSKIPIIGVGEATTSLLPHVLHKILDYDVYEFHKEVQPSWKLGVKFDWAKLNNQCFNAPMGNADFVDAYMYSDNINNCSFFSQLMDAEKSAIYKTPGNEEYKSMHTDSNMAYHIDNQRFVKYLHEKRKNSPILHLDRLIKSVEKVDDTIQALITEDNERLSFDLYIDCSGFKSLLSGERSTDFIDYSSSLFTNSAVFGWKPQSEKIKPYTSASVMKYGWLWETPLPTEEHIGYVYDSNFVEESEIREYLENRFPDINLNPRSVKYKPGRIKNFWKENIVSIGNAYSFVEPLDATGIHVICEQILGVVQILSTKREKDQLIAKLNQFMGKKIDLLRGLIAMRFKFCQSKGSSFWEACRTETDMSGLEPYLTHFYENGPLSLSPNSKIYSEMKPYCLFSVESYDFIMLAMDVPTKWEINVMDESKKEKFLSRVNFQKHLVNNFISMAEALKLVNDRPQVFKSFNWDIIFDNC